ncbi:retention module-containing protein [Marinomonas sp. GJ51-6]|uniref:retention module-containing protein n=1 Tax=Marinomonas sp. GJ51-6 TaxID=2992802 RepID=UPI0029342642|nr:retention module-containing protein [Marinomonas sp. GJ51-6]WOD07031.1 retention module-containing protein [Marinomonas sp. GJ51-6]
MSDNQNTFATLGDPVGIVTKLSGSVTVQSIDGQTRELQIGDQIYFAETIITGTNASVTIAFVDGTEVVIGGDSIVEINEEVYNPGSNEELVEDATAEAEALQAAILAGDDPTLVQDAPAAGDTAEQDRVDVSIDRNNTSVQIGFGNDTESSLPTYGYDTDNGSRSISVAVFSIRSTDDRSSSDISDTTSVAQFVDGLVNGVSYTTSSGLSGLTGDQGADGSFQYNEGDTITFSVGGVVVAEFSSSVIQGGYLFLQDIAGVELSDLNNNYVENMAIFLQAIQDGLTDSDTGTDSDDGILQTNDLTNLEEVSGVITITAEMREALADYDLSIIEMDKEDLSDLLAAIGIEFTRDSEIADGTGENVFETLAMEHVQDSIETYAGDRIPDEFDERTPDVIEFNQGTVTYDFTEVEETGQLTFSASDLANGVVTNQVFEENLAVSNVSLGAGFEDLGELVDNGDGTYTINITKDDLTPYDLEGLSFDFTVNDWTASYTESSSVALDTNKSHLSTDISEVSESDEYAQFTLSSTLSFDEAQTLKITFTSELLSEALGKQIAEYADDFSMPFEYSTDGGETWISATLDSMSVNENGILWPTFAIELPADSTSIEVRIPIFDDVEVEGDEYIEAVITGDNFYDENVSVKIIDNDTEEATQPVVSIDYVYAIEGQEYAEFTISLSEASTTDVTVDYGVVGVGATAGEDFEDVSGTVTIPAGQTSVTVQVPIIDDTEIEDAEMAFVTLSNVTGDAVLGDMQGSLRIFDNDSEDLLQVNLDIDPVTEDSIVNNVEADEMVTITGSVTGDDFVSGLVTLYINEVQYNAVVGSDGVWSVDVQGSDLAADSDGQIDASVLVSNGEGQQGTARLH